MEKDGFREFYFSSVGRPYLGYFKHCEPHDVIWYLHDGELKRTYSNYLCYVNELETVNYPELVELSKRLMESCNIDTGIHILGSEKSEMGRKTPLAQLYEFPGIDAFRSTGLLLLVNNLLSTFGWGIMDLNGALVPAKGLFKPFSEKAMSECRKKISGHLSETLAGIDDESQHRGDENDG